MYCNRTLGVPIIIASELETGPYITSDIHGGRDLHLSGIVISPYRLYKSMSGIETEKGGDQDKI